MGITITIPKLVLRIHIGSNFPNCFPGSTNTKTGEKYVLWEFLNVQATYNRTEPIPGDTDNEIRWFRATLPISPNGLTYGGMVVDIPFYFKKSTGKHTINLKPNPAYPEIDKYQRGILIVSLDGNSPQDGKVKFAIYPCGDGSNYGTFLYSSEIVNFPVNHPQFMSRGWNLVPPAGVDLILF